MKNLKAIALILLLSFGFKSHSQIINDVFDESPGQNFYQNGLGSFNWVDATSFGLTNNAGSEAFLSANGNTTPFNDLGLTKELGGVIQDSVYTVSFYITKYTSLGVSFSDFDQLRIGGSAGTCQWIQTPNPIQGVWQQWMAIYTPDTADFGDPFEFTMVFDLQGNNTSVAIDGPVTVSVNLTSVNHLQHQPLKVFPNPANDFLFLSSPAHIDKVSIVDAFGKVIKSEVLNSKEGKIDITKLDAGLYFMIAGDTRTRFIKY